MVSSIGVEDWRCSVVYLDKLKSSANMELWKKAALFTYVFLLSFCCAVDLLCTVKRNGTRMVHSISLESHASGFLSAGCDSSWSNETTVLATSSDKHATLMTNSFHTLETYECHGYILWMAQCWSAEGLMDYIANCTTTCDVMNLRQGDKDNPGVGDSKTFIYIIVGVLLLLGLLGLIVLSYKFKVKICSMLTFVRRLYAPVPKQNDAELSNVVIERQ